MGDEGRALLTEREREILRREADVDDNYRYKVESIVRSRLRGQLARDVAVLEEHFDDGYEIVEEVCEDLCDDE